MIAGYLRSWARYGLLGANVVATRALDVLRQQARTLEISLEGVRNLAVEPVCAIPCPVVDPARLADPVRAILDDPRFDETDAYFARSPASRRSLISARAQALLYALVRNLAPDHVVEIGVYKAATTEAIARALQANRKGTIHAVDPFRTEHIAAILRQWPPELADHVAFHPMSSVDFLASIGSRGLRPSLVLVDGDHAYEAAHFDMFGAARHLLPGGFMLVDNIAQPGPFLAARDFLERSPGWIECGGPMAGGRESRPYDRRRSPIPGTELLVLRAPAHQHVWRRPWSPGQMRGAAHRIEGVRLSFAPATHGGSLALQVVLRGFGRDPVELVGDGDLKIAAGCDAATVMLAQPVEARGDFTHLTAEPWLVWDSESRLQLSGPVALL